MVEFNIHLNPSTSKKTMDRAGGVTLNNALQTGEIVWAETSNKYIVSYNIIKGTVSCSCPSMVLGGRICKHVVALVNAYHEKLGTKNPIKEEDVNGN